MTTLRLEREIARASVLCKEISPVYLKKALKRATLSYWHTTYIRMTFGDPSGASRLQMDKYRVLCISMSSAAAHRRYEL